MRCTQNRRDKVESRFSRSNCSANAIGKFAFVFYSMGNLNISTLLVLPALYLYFRGECGRGRILDIPSRGKNTMSMTWADLVLSLSLSFSLVRSSSPSSLSGGKYGPRGASRRHKANDVPLVLTSRKSFRIAAAKVRGHPRRSEFAVVVGRVAALREKGNSMIYLYRAHSDGPP